MKVFLKILMWIVIVLVVIFVVLQLSVIISGNFENIGDLIQYLIERYQEGDGALALARSGLFTRL